MFVSRGLCYLYVLGCDRIIGRDAPATGRPDELDRGTAASDQADAAVTLVSWENALALIVSIPVAIYLVAALLFPERF